MFARPTLSGSLAYVYEKCETLSSLIFLSNFTVQALRLVACLMYGKVSHSMAKQQDMFQLLIRAKQYRDGDSRLISPSELIAVPRSAMQRKWTTFGMTFGNLPRTERDVKSWTQDKTCDNHKNSERVPSNFTALSLA